MTVVTGDIRLVTDKPDSVSQVWLRAPKGRVQGSAYVTESPDARPVENGAVSFTAFPGPLVMVLVAQGQPLNSVKLIVPDKANATLRECIEAVGLVDDGTLSALEELALEVSSIAGQIASADQLETWAGETASAASQAQISKSEANDAASRAGVYASNAKQSETNSKQSESNANAAAERASSTADEVYGELQGFADSASDSADSAANSATEAKTAETNAKAHEVSASSSAQRAEFAAEETIQQVEGDFATRNYVDGKSWGKGDITYAHQTMADVGVGAWNIAGRDHAVRLGLPLDFGSLQVMMIGNSKTAFFIGQETGMWIATSQGQVWGEWKRPGATLDELNNVGAGLKTVPVAVSTGAGGAGELSGRYRVLTQVTAPVTRFRVHFSTAHPMWEGNRGQSTLGDVYIGHRSGDAGITNQITLKTGNSTVAAAGEWVSQWITHDLSRETLIDFQVTATNAYNLIAPAWKQDGASWVQQATVPLWVWLEVETYAETPTVALVGDSTGAGSGSHMPVWDSALHIHARREGFIPVLYASSGDLLEGNTDPEDRNYKRWAEFGPYDSVIIQAGSNDIHNGTALSAMQEHYIAVTEAVAQLSPVVIGATVKPRYPAHPEYDSTRIAYNNWLKTQPGSTRAVVDFSAAVAPTGAIDPADNADGAHLTSSGHQKLATAFDNVLVSRPAWINTVAGSFAGTGSPEGKVTAPVGSTYTDSAATAGAIRWIKATGAGGTGWRVEYGDTGWRKITSLIPTVTRGEVYIRREGNKAFIWFDYVALTDGATMTLPAGWWPSHTASYPVLDSAADKAGVVSHRFSVLTFSFTGTVAGVVESAFTTVPTAWPTSLPGTPA